MNDDQNLRKTPTCSRCGDPIGDFEAGCPCVFDGGKVQKRWGMRQMVKRKLDRQRGEAK